MREKMNVRVIDGQVAPRSLRHAESMIPDEVFTFTPGFTSATGSLHSCLNFLRCNTR